MHPVVAIGQHGLTPAVLHEIDVNLLAHELIKIRVFGDERDEREALLARICTELDAAPVQHLGKILTIWRPAPPPELEPVVRRPERRVRAKKMDGGTTATRKTSTSTPPRAGTATTAKKAPRRGRSVIEGLPSAKRTSRGGPGAKPASRRPPPPHGKSASSRVGASGARRRRKAR